MYMYMCVYIYIYIHIYTYYTITLLFHTNYKRCGAALGQASVKPTPSWGSPPGRVMLVDDIFMLVVIVVYLFIGVYDFI